MANDRLYIPEKINVGYQEREGTYTGKLAYVIYYDDKGVLRKERSWQSWRDDKIPNQEFENKPTEGFVLNKGVGGVSYSRWNSRNEYIRVYDPRDFEFEISVANLLFILRECDCTKGKGLEGQFVYSWDKTELVLLPVNSQEYQESQQFTELKSNVTKIKLKDLVVGYTYQTVDHSLTYLGRFDAYNVMLRYYSTDLKSGKYHVFYDGKNFQLFKSGFNAIVTSKEMPDNFAELVEEYQKSRYGSKIKELEFKPAKTGIFVKGYHGEFYQLNTYRNDICDYKVWLDEYPRSSYRYNDFDAAGKERGNLYIVLESGSKFKYKESYSYDWGVKE